METINNNGFTCLKRSEAIRSSIKRSAQIAAATLVVTGMIGASVFCGAQAFAQNSEAAASDYANKVVGDEGMPSAAEWNAKMAQYDANNTLNDNETEILWCGVPKCHMVENKNNEAVAEVRSDIVNTEGAATDWYYKVEGTELYITKTPADDSFKQFKLVDGMWDLSDIPSGLTKIRTNYDKFIENGTLSNISSEDYAELMAKPYFAEKPTPQSDMYYYTLDEADQIFEDSLMAQMSWHSNKFDRCTISWKAIKTI